MPVPGKKKRATKQSTDSSPVLSAVFAPNIAVAWSLFTVMR